MSKVKVPPITTELKEAVELYRLATAYRQVIEPVVTGYQAEILARHQWRMSPKFQAMHRAPIDDADLIVLDPDRVYYLGDEDFDVYLAEVHGEHKAHGFDVPDDFCPLLIAKNDEMQAGNLVLKAARYITHINPAEFWDMDARAKLLDLTVQFVVKAAHINTDDALKRLGARRIVEAADDVQAQQAASERGAEATRLAETLRYSPGLVFTPQEAELC